MVYLYDSITVIDRQSMDSHAKKQPSASMLRILYIHKCIEENFTLYIC